MKKPQCYNYYERTETECRSCNFSNKCRKNTSEFTLESLDHKLADIVLEMTQEEAKTLIEALADKYDLDLIVYEK